MNRNSAPMNGNHLADIAGSMLFGPEMLSCISR